MAKNKEIFRTKSSRVISVTDTNGSSTGFQGTLTINPGSEGSVIRNISAIASNSNTTVSETILFTVNIITSGSPEQLVEITITNSDFDIATGTSTNATQKVNLLKFLPSVLDGNGNYFLGLESNQSLEIVVLGGVGNNFIFPQNSSITALIEDY